jgi:hypothetical protein
MSEAESVYRNPMSIVSQNCYGNVQKAINGKLDQVTSKEASGALNVHLDWEKEFVEHSSNNFLGEDFLGVIRDGW